ncbi:hypothetical protein A2291_00235 [candidate division WOR-1 bacterium RIFOXYB2_FULL_42_35]|uniref:TonB C-terminal domain-containing protein n=1 Tax=candidate division WOR-1 bacterium RIFOXYC2_FULL_41_25 TaxID=1802586 RepID=A0A1F4TMT2_UNCSA|nr:MAG: hypothetical protein A2247_05755 [candidate division WOR-1 bacterium RIFOXYA2_FULL_41_14]OGC24143.1 MAG: hypothetical protein A2291_00235 [candidate division WOR-1 bacterium RIFOXYB2_FULL_42_35]OGC33830.1 MAG: hypothetical protein A2462_01910 [candidate division WOR-1 bacterium RIFOXYC2_FULL_41_25]OGC41812.1 MAG: hypothetical protein A2548_03950 [candidate division WOR-1 bacterium RIFOXYD2_FULL_41_8]
MFIAKTEKAKTILLNSQASSFTQKNSLKYSKMGRVIASVTIQGSKVVKVSAQRTGRARLDSAITSALSKAWKGRAMAGVGNAEIKLPIMLQQAMF